MGDELERLRVNFYAGIRTPACPVVVNDEVDLVGSAKGSGSVISIEALEPEPTLLIELGSDGSEHFSSLSELRSRSAHRGMTVNERLYAASLMDIFDDAVRHRDRAAMIRILRFVHVDPAEATADPILKDPRKYGY